MKEKIPIVFLLLVIITQKLIGLSPLPTSFWEGVVVGFVEDEMWIGNSCGIFRIENDTKIQEDGNLTAWIHHSHHGWIWIESADLSKAKITRASEYGYSNVSI